MKYLKYFEAVIDSHSKALIKSAHADLIKPQLKAPLNVEHKRFP